MITDSWVQGSQTNEGTLKIAAQKQENVMLGKTCVRQQSCPLSPVVSEWPRRQTWIQVLPSPLLAIGSWANAWFYLWSLRLLIWKMGRLLIAMPVHRNVRSLNEKSQPVVGAQGDGRWRQGMCSVEHVGAEAAMALAPGPLLSTGSVAWCLLTWLWAQCWGARGSPWATTPLG